MIRVGPIICKFDQERLKRAQLVLVLSRKGTVREVPLPTVWVGKNSSGTTGNAICGQPLFDALWAMGEACEDEDHRVIYLNGGTGRG